MADVGTTIINVLLTGGSLFVCLSSFYFLRIIKGKPYYKFIMIGWVALAFLMILIVNFALKENALGLWPTVLSLLGGCAATAALCIPVHLYRKKKAPETTKKVNLNDYPHFVADRLLHIGVHHVEFSENPEKDGYNMKGKDSYGQKVCVKSIFTPDQLDEKEIINLAGARDLNGFKRCLLFTNSSFTDDAKAIAKEYNVELIEHFRK